MLYSRPPDRRDGFTLVEVLVVVAILALLVAILVPSLSRARSGARATQCRSQIREAVIAISEYTAEWKDVFPRGASPVEVHWTRLIARVFGEKANYTNINQLNVERFEPFHCPERTLQLPHAFVDYVVNALLAVPNASGGPAWTEAKYGRMSEFKRPGSVIYLLDAERESRNTAGRFLSLQTARLNWKEGKWRLYQEDPEEYRAVDGMDVYLGEHLPQGYGGPEFNTSDAPGRRRVARNMHMARWTNAGFLDGHAEGLQLEHREGPFNGYNDSPNGNYAAWLRRFGVKEEHIETMAKVLDAFTTEQPN